MKIFIFEPLWNNLAKPHHEKMLRETGAEITIITNAGKLSDCNELFSGTEPRIIGINPDYVEWSLPAEAFNAIPNLKAIVTASTSFGWIDVVAAKQRNIAVLNIRNFSTEAVAEWAIMMMLNLARKVPLLIKNSFPLNFGSDYSDYRGSNLKGRKAGIIGLGNIGAAIADHCNGLGMEVCYWSQSPKQSSYRHQSLEALFESCDVIFPCMADNEDTKGIITDKMLKGMKQESIFVSVVHKYYNHALLLEQAAQEHIYGYGFEAEANSFSDFKGNVWAAPAYAWCTAESMALSLEKFVTALTQASQGIYTDQINS